jgi:signal transduction histidine kinase
MALYKHQAEKEKTELQAQLAQARKMEAIATLAAGLAHNFNNILMMVMGFTELAILKMPEENKTVKYLQQAWQGCERAKNIVSQFLSFTRSVEPDPQKIQFEPLLKETFAFLNESLPANITSNLDIDTSPGLIVGNPSRLKEMLGHLYSNAVQAMREKGGRIRVKLEEIMLREEQKSPGESLPPGQYWKLTVSDTGRGMDLAVMDRIFEPFFSTEEFGSSLGLGLSVVYGIVRSHYGNITVSSQPDHGTTFTILIPKLEN